MSGYFVPGWHPQYGEAAYESMSGSFVTADFGDDSPLPEAMSLSSITKWDIDQGPVGSCFACAAGQAFQIVTAGDNLDGYAKWEEFELSKSMVWYEGRRMDGLLGSRSDGGSVTNAMMSMSDKGIGCCKESTWPYKPDHNWLERKPSSDAMAEANSNRVLGVAKSPIGDEWKRSIKNLTPVAIGIWWPYGWDNRVGKDGRVTGIGSGTFGHALVVIGYHSNWGGATWWQIQNSHGAIYNPVPRDIAASIKGYVGHSSDNPDAVYHFWVRDDMLREVINYGNSEQIIVSGLNGFRAKALPWGSVL